MKKCNKNDYKGITIAECHPDSKVCLPLHSFVKEMSGDLYPLTLTNANHKKPVLRNERHVIFN